MDEVDIAVESIDWNDSEQVKNLLRKHKDKMIEKGIIKIIEPEPDWSIQKGMKHIGDDCAGLIKDIVWDMIMRERMDRSINRISRIDYRIFPIIPAFPNITSRRFMNPNDHTHAVDYTYSNYAWTEADTLYNERLEITQVNRTSNRPNEYIELNTYSPADSFSRENNIEGLNREVNIDGNGSRLNIWEARVRAHYRNNRR